MEYFNRIFSFPLREVVVAVSPVVRFGERGEEYLICIIRNRT